MGSFLISLIITSISALVSLFLVMYYPLNDPFGEKHPIPQDMEFNIPLDMESHDNPVADSLDTDSYLQIRNDFQGGIYLYDFYAARIEVWHKDAATGEETKLCEKTYRVEGWMR